MTWQPGDPIYHESACYVLCPHCGCGWEDTVPVMHCPDCDLPIGAAETDVVPSDSAPEAHQEG